MNVKNCLKNPSYFIPDPWTQTETDGSVYSNFIKSILVQTVNDNSISRISFKNIFFIIFIFLRFVRFKDFFSFIKLANLMKEKKSLNLTNLKKMKIIKKIFLKDILEMELSFTV